MDTITIPQKQYQDLMNTKIRYERLREAMEEDLFSSPPTKNARKIIKEFKATGKYNQNFLKSLHRGLEESSYFQK